MEFQDIKKLLEKAEGYSSYKEQTGEFDFRKDAKIFIEEERKQVRLLKKIEEIYLY